MCSELKEFIGKVIQAAKQSKKIPTQENRETYRQLFSQGPFFDHLHETVYRRIRRLWNNPQDLEDLCQEISMVIYTDLDRYRFEPDRFDGWVMTIARNKTIDFLRKKYSATAGGDFDLESIDETVLTHELRSEDNPLKNLLDRERSEALFQAIEQLPEQQRLVSILYYAEGFTQEQIGHILSLSRSRVAAILGEAIHALRQKIGTDEKLREIFERRGS